MNKRLSVLVSVVILVLVVLGILAFVYFHKNTSKQASPQVETTKLTQSKIEYAPSGKLVSSFPNSLILDSAATTSQSLDFTYKGNRQSTVTLYSKETPETVFDQYKKYLTTNGYKIISELSKTNSYSLYASGSTADVDVAAQIENKQTQITISYINK
jgi:Tfp pilus assembly protein PilV